MGLRTASPRHPNVVMAPALTETTQSQNFDLAPKVHFEVASPITSLDPTQYLDKEQEFYNDAIKTFTSGVTFDDAEDYCISLESLDKSTVKPIGALDNFNTDSINMNSVSMGDQDNNKMGLQKTRTETISNELTKDRMIATDVEQLMKNFNAETPAVDAANELPSNVDDIIQVITSIERGSDQLSNVANELNDEEFSISQAELANNLLSFEKQLLTDVDIMNISIEDQQESDNVENVKVLHSNELIAESQKMQARVQRRLDFLRRRIFKFQSHLMGQHISGEVSGVFEHVHRSLRRLKDSSLHDTSKSMDIQSADSMAHVSDPSSEKIKPMSFGSAKALVRKLEMSSILQANSAARQRHVPKYFGSGSIEPSTFRTSVSGMVAIPPWPTENKQELQKVSGLLHSELGIVQGEVDSEATDSSSGGESCDEFQNYNNQHQQYLSIQKRALWKYSTERAAMAARWTWLQVQISDLEYRIRQHTELHRKIRLEKGTVELGGSCPVTNLPTSPTTVNGYRGQLPGNCTEKTLDEIGQSEFQCARTRPLVGFRKRKLLQTKGLHVISKKAARPSTVRCGCVAPLSSCALCTGRSDPTYPRDPPEILSKPERVAALDPCFHPVFSLAEDVSESIHLEAIMKMSEWQQRSSRMKSLKGYAKLEKSEKNLSDHRSKHLEQRKKYKYARLLKSSTMAALSKKIKNKIRGRKPGRHHSYKLNRKRLSTSIGSTGDVQPNLSGDGMDEEMDLYDNNDSNHASLSLGGSPSSSPLLHMQSISSYNKKNRINSYDIDNIVIPYSVAASTRVEKLEYKEILTPKWRIADSDSPAKYDKNNGAVKDTSQDSDVEAEDLSEEAVISRHDKSEYDEKKKFLSYLKFPLGYGRARSHKRTDSRAESSGANTPDPMSPPHTVENHENTSSPITSPPATPLSLNDDSVPLPSISVLRRRTISQSRFRDKEINRDDINRCNTPENVEVAPFDNRMFPLDDDTYDKMLQHMPEDHQFKTNSRAQDTVEFTNSMSYIDGKIGSPGSESTESALMDEDPNDPEWIDVERMRDRHKR